MEFVYIEDLVPKDHILRKKQAIDHNLVDGKFNFFRIIVIPRFLQFINRNP